jgi:hypothetical protein
MTHGVGQEYLVSVPPEPVNLFRLLSGEAAGANEFASNHALEKVRLWPGRGEDVAEYRGISAFETADRALTLAQRVNDGLRRKGLRLRWTHVAEFEVDGHLGVALARTRTEGHFTVWGEPEGLSLRVQSVLPIPMQGDG